MTPRLKMLSVMLALSIVYSVYDYIDRNKTDKQIVKTTRKTTKRPGTARVSRTRAADLNKRLNNQKETQTKKSFSPQHDFLPLPDEIISLEGWSRNPFMEVFEPVNTPKVEINKSEKKEVVEDYCINLSLWIDHRNSHTMGEKAFVTINGQTFQEGDLLMMHLLKKGK